MANADHSQLAEDNLEIICGTNEEYLIGFKLKVKCGKKAGVVLETSFADHSHSGSVRHLVLCGQYLVSGGTDEMLHVFNLSKRCKSGVIGDHGGTITALQQQQQFLFSAAEDGKICIYKQGKWETKATLLGHKGAVNSVSIHPRAPMALSVGADSTLHIWDLVKGRRATAIKLKEVASLVKWSPSGAEYAVVSNNKVDLYDAQSAGLRCSLQLQARVNDVAYVEDTTVLIALDDGSVVIHDTEAVLQSWTAHDARVRAMAMLASHGRLLLVTGSSDGWIKLWQLEEGNFASPAKLLASHQTNCRVTCLALYSAPDSGKKAVQQASCEHNKTSKDNAPKPAAAAKKRVTVEEEKSSEDDDDGDETLQVIQGQDALALFGYRKPANKPQLKQRKRSAKTIPTKLSKHHKNK